MQDEGDGSAIGSGFDAVDSVLRLPASTSSGSQSEEVFARLLNLLPNEVKHLLLLEALETCGPSCLVGLEDARDKILYAAVRLEPALLRSVTSFLDSGEDLPDGDGDMPGTKTGLHPDQDNDSDSSGGFDKREPGVPLQAATGPGTGSGGSASDTSDVAAKSDTCDLFPGLHYDEHVNFGLH